MAALGVGLAATILPTALAYGMTSKDSRAEDIGIFVGIASGVIAGPAIGLWSGDRADLAGDGLVVRSVGCLLGLGAMGVASATFKDGQSVELQVALAIVGVAGGFVAAGSLFHDLAITPSATSEARRMRVGLGLRSDGLPALSVRF
jgi:hypothetical protein